MPLIARLAFLVLFAVCASLAPADTLRPQGANWSLEIPDGWNAAPEEVRANFQEFFRANAAFGNIKVEQAYVPKTESEEVFNLLIVCTLPTGFEGATWEDVEKSLGAETFERETKRLKEQVKDVDDVQVQAPRLDRDKLRVEVDVRTKMPDGAEIIGITVTYLGKSKCVQICGYTTPDRLDQDRAMYEAIFATFKFDDGHAYVPRERKAGMRFGIIIGVVIAVAIVSILISRR